jgi:plastocyanin
MTLKEVCVAVLLATGLPLSARAATVEVTIDKLAYLPAEVAAKVGDTVEWINKDPFAHTATAKNGEWDVMIGPKKIVRLVLKKAGVVDYYCKFHPNMKARIAISP